MKFYIFLFLILYTNTQIEAQDLKGERFEKVFNLLNSNEIGLDSLDILSSKYSSLGQYWEALLINSKVVKKRKEILGRNHPNYLFSLSNLAKNYSSLGLYDIALEIQTKVVNKNKEIWGEKHLNYLTSLNNLASIYFMVGHYEKMLEILINVTENQKNILGENHAEYLTSLSNLSLCYSELGQYVKALDIQTTVVNKLKEIFEENHPNYLMGLNNLSLRYSNLGQYLKALEIQTTVVDKQKEIFGENHPDYLTSLNSLASIYSNLGQYEKTLQILIKVAEKQKEIFGENYPNYLTSLNNLASVYSDLGQHVKALEIHSEVAEKRKEILGENHPIYILGLNNLAISYFNIGQYKKALGLLNASLERQKEILGEKHPVYITCLSNLASIYSEVGQYAKALEIKITVAEMRKEILGENHPEYLISLNNLAQSYSNFGQHEKALDIYIEAAEKQRDILGKKHPDYLITLNNIAFINSKIGLYEDAQDVTNKVVERQKEIVGENHPNYLNILGNLIFLSEIFNDIDSALSYSKLVLNSQKQTFKDYFTFLTESEKENYTNKYSNSFNAFQSFSLRNFRSLPTLGNENFNLALSTKGQVLLSSVNVKKEIAATQDTSLQKTYDQWVMYKKIIEKKSLQPIAERDSSYEQIIEKANKLERKLVKASTYLKEQKKSAEITFKEVQHHLKENEVGIEFISFQYSDKNGLSDSVFYAALLLNKTDISVKYIPLFEEKQLESLMIKKSSRESTNINTLYKNPNLYDLLWKPLAMQIPKGSTVYYSPSGMLHQLHLATITDSDSTYLADSYQFIPLSTTSKIAFPKKDIVANSIAVFGGMQYDKDEGNYVNSDSIIFNLTEDIVNRSYFAPDSTRCGKWTYLPATLDEANNIIKIATQKKLDVKPYLSYSGNEENFKGLGLQKSPSIIHIASHGFFFPNQEKGLKKMNAQLYGDYRFVTSELTLNRSGLLFSGSNKAWMEGTKVNSAQDDGILTALEVGNTALFNTDLVVLSACETGLGDIKGSEGVYGLQRAFKMAGARYLMMSLWKVPDNATQEFMTTFYTELLTNKKSIRDAYNTTQKQMRNKYRDEPYKWGGFVLME